MSCPLPYLFLQYLQQTQLKIVIAFKFDAHFLPDQTVDMSTKKRDDETANNNEANKMTKAVNLDRILIEEIGEIGPYQLRILALSVIVVIFAAWAATEYIFTTSRITTRYKRLQNIFNQVKFNNFTNCEIHLNITIIILYVYV